MKNIGNITNDFIDRYSRLVSINESLDTSVKYYDWGNLWRTFDSENDTIEM